MLLKILIDLKGNIFNLGLSEANLTKEQLCIEIKKIVEDFKFEISKDGKDEDKKEITLFLIKK